MSVYYNQDKYVIRNDNGLVYYDDIYPPATTTTTTTICEADLTNIGSYTLGGVVAYIFNSGNTGYISGYISGIIVATTDSTSSVWGCYNTSITGLNSAIGYGKSNTLAIISQCSGGSAALVASGYTDGTYHDWFLGSYGDMNAICANKAYIPNLQLFAGAAYSNSNQNNALTYQTNYLYNCGNGNRSKNNVDFVRPVRYFSVIDCRTGSTTTTTTTLPVSTTTTTTPTTTTTTTLYYNYYLAIVKDTWCSNYLYNQKLVTRSTLSVGYTYKVNQNDSFSWYIVQILDSSQGSFNYIPYLNYSGC